MPLDGALMFNFIKDWFIEIIVLFILVIFTWEFLIKKIGTKFFSLYKSRTKQIKKYWVGVLILILLTVTAHIASIQFFEINPQWIDLINHYSTLLFAVYAGYIAFRTYETGRIDKIVELALANFKVKRYVRASKFYEEALQIDPDDFSTRASYIELLIVTNNSEKYHEQIQLLNKIQLENREKIVGKYLEAVKMLIDENTKDAKVVIASIVEDCAVQFDAWKLLGWDFMEIEQSEAYEKLKGDPKNILSGLIEFLDYNSRNISPEDAKQKLLELI